MIPDTTLAYLAGIIDGEGCIRIRKTKATGSQGRATSYYQACVQARMADASALNLLALTFGGTVCLEAAVSPKHRPLYFWMITDKKAERALRSLLPFLRVKLQIAEIVIAFRGHQADGPLHRTKVLGHREYRNAHGTSRTVETRGYSDEYLAISEAFHLKVKDMNHPQR